MIRRRVPEQTRMRRGRWGWELIRPDKTTVEPAHLRNSRISDRLLREMLRYGNLRITYHRVLVDDDGLHVDMVLPESVDEPAEWSPFDAAAEKRRLANDPTVQRRG